MFDSFLSKFKGIFSSDTHTVTSQPATTNRAVYTPAKKAVKAKPEPVAAQPTVDLTQVNLQAQAILDNARKIETDAKVKEAEIRERLKSLDSKEQYLIQKEKSIDNDTADLKKRLADVDDVLRRQLDKLEQISGLDIEKAKQLILSSTEKKLSSWIAKKIEESKESLKSQEDELAKEVLVEAIQHGITDYVAEYTVSTISLPDETIKGKIIGREGRNIRAFEKVTGVEIELDETNDIRISSFDSTRREIARLALEKLIKDGRIQPVRIEQLVAQTKQDMDKILLNEGKKICQEVGVFNLPIDLIKEIGKYKFRFSYGQNLAKHTIEATKIAVNIAQQLHADVNTVRLGTLLHDLGKVISDQEGTHIDLGVDLLRQYHLPEAVIACVAEHHSDDFSSKESAIVYVGDAASGARPGARYEVHEEYLKRMTNIEDVAKGFPGVLSVAAYQAGREVMVIVDPGIINDSEAEVLSQNIASRLEEEAKWAGQIKVTVVRELRTSSVIVGSKINKSAVKN
ncbi:MAG TPA: Rnase Y domain-containing protein [Candidatus Woesebacteria bacterium]|nr:Rnase Y domain-containing protein [Candidatus Woesebacteria bacterium]